MIKFGEGVSDLNQKLGEGEIDETKIGEKAEREIAPEKIKQDMERYEIIVQAQKQIWEDLEKRGIKKIDENVLQQVATERADKEQEERKEYEKKQIEKRTEWNALDLEIYHALDACDQYRSLSKLDGIRIGIEKINGINNKFGEYIPEKEQLQKIITISEKALDDFLTDGRVKFAVKDESKKRKWDKELEETEITIFNTMKQNLEKKAAQAKERIVEIEKGESEKS